MKAPIFSTYRQGENRVTASMLAVLERIDLAVVERLLAAASGEASLQMVRFANQPSGPASVPDGSISAGFDYLFEVKTERGAVDADQLRRHLMRLDGGPHDQRLFLVTPDADTPPQVDAVGDDRLVWFNFAALDQAMDDVVRDDTEPVSDRERFLLRELQRLFDGDGLLASAEDVVIVAARFAYADYQQFGAYLCQTGRTFRSGVTRMGFYRQKRIEPELPRFVHRVAALMIGTETVDELQTSDTPFAGRIGRLVQTLLDEASPRTGRTLQLILLSEPDDDDTVRLPNAIEHLHPWAWTQGQRYARLSELQRAPASTDELGSP